MLPDPYIFYDIKVLFCSGYCHVNKIWFIPQYLPLILRFASIRYMRADSTPFLYNFLYSLSFCIFFNIVEPGGERLYEKCFVLIVNDGYCFLRIHG